MDLISYTDSKSNNQTAKKILLGNQRYANVGWLFDTEDMIVHFLGMILLWGF